MIVNEYLISEIATSIAEPSEALKYGHDFETPGLLIFSATYIANFPVTL